MDSAFLQEEDARYLNKKKATRHHPALPLYNIEDAEQALTFLQPVSKEEWHILCDGLSFRLLRSGHILGSTFVQFSIDVGNGQKIITFSGDLGHDRQNVIKGPVNIKETDVLVLESTYGDRFLPKVDVFQQIKEVVNRTLLRGGVLVIPSFAVGRTQELLYILAKLEKEKLIPDGPIYVDSPMANNTTDIYLKYKEELRLSFNNGSLEYPICPEHFQAIRSVDESMMITMSDGPFIVISAAGMLTGGRVLHHLRKRLPDPKNTVLFVGYQVEETKGRLLQQGLPKIRIHKQLIDVEAEILSISTLSAHGDSQDLLNWVERIGGKPSQVFLNHGEPAALNALKYRLETELGLNVKIPHPAETFNIE